MELYPTGEENSDEVDTASPASVSWSRAELLVSSFSQAGWGTPANAGLERALVIFVRVNGSRAGIFHLDEIRIE